MKTSKEYQKGFLKAVALIKSLDNKSFDWHIKTFGDGGATAGDYAIWAKKVLDKLSHS